MNKNVGIVGVGKMGKPILRHLARAGFNPIFYDTDSNIRIRGASKVGSCMALSKATDTIFVIVGTDAQVSECFLGKDGLLKDSVKGKIFVVVSTVEPLTLKKVARAASRKGAKVLDAPVCWGEPAAIRGQLVSYVGGDRAAFRKTKPFLDAYSKAVFFLGPLGSGLVAKTANNHLMWVCRFANLETLLLASRYYQGDMRTLYEALLAGTCSNRCLERLSAGGDIPWAVKDLNIVLGLAKKEGERADFAKVASRAARNKNMVDFNREGLPWLRQRRVLLGV